MCPDQGGALTLGVSFKRGSTAVCTLLRGRVWVEVVGVCMLWR